MDLDVIPEESPAQLAIPTSITGAKKTVMQPVDEETQSNALTKPTAPV